MQQSLVLAFVTTALILTDQMFGTECEGNVNHLTHSALQPSFINVFFFLSDTSLFTFQPENATTSYGEIVEFRCGVTNYDSVTVEIFIQTSSLSEDQDLKVYPNMSAQLNKILRHRGELFADYTRNESCSGCNEGVGIIWMVANERILNLVKCVYCRAHIRNTSSVYQYSSNVTGYITRDCNMTVSPNPECLSLSTTKDESSSPSSSSPVFSVPTTYSGASVHMKLSHQTLLHLSGLLVYHLIQQLLWQIIWRHKV